VRFNDSEESIVSSTFVYPGVEEELYSCLYYSKREISDIRMASKQRAMSIEASNQNIVSSIHHLYGVAKTEYAPALSDRDAADQLVQSGARGLEHFLTPRFGKQREWAVHMILKVQEEYQDSEDVEHLLRKWSETLSSSSCHYARNVAMIDAREAIRESMRSSSTSSRSI
jgi:HPt (histidine-containing phosphotransfer) domain-containing protein